MDGGIKRKQSTNKKSAPRGNTSRKSASRKSAPRGHANKNRAKSRRSITLPKTHSARSRKSAERNRAARADMAMSMTDLQMMAKSRGIPFGGLSKARLAQKINNYAY